VKVAFWIFVWALTSVLAGSFLAALVYVCGMDAVVAIGAGAIVGGAVAVLGWGLWWEQACSWDDDPW
jgi:hypothetical protein